MIDPWIYAAGAVIVGLLSGVVGAALVRVIILKGRDDRPEAHDAARATATFLFLFFAVLGVIVAIGFTNPDTLEPIPADVVRKSPLVLSAGLILIAGRAIAFALGGMVNAAFAGSSSRLRVQLGAASRFLVTAVALVLAHSQLGVDTTIPSIIGVRKLPLAVGDAPSTPWKNNGTKKIAPNIASPVRNETSNPIPTMRFRNTARGRIGSETRDS